MTFAFLKFLTGTLAAICTTIAFVPQIVKIRRSGGRDLSYPMLFLYLVGLILWLAYGIMIRAGAVIGANTAAICLVSVCIAMKWKYERVPRPHSSESLQAGAVPQKKTNAALGGLPAD